MEPMPGEAGLTSNAERADDTVRPLTRLVAGFVIIILLMAIYVLYLHPDETAQLFAWTIKPRMTPLAMGAGYAMGAYFFARVLVSKQWHRVAAGFLPITMFTIFMLVATILHLDRFNRSISFWLWSVIYAITPLLVPGVWFLNRRSDPGTPEPGDLLVPPLVRRIAALAGITTILFGILILIVPEVAINNWPWVLTPLTGRVLAGWMMLPGMGGLVLSREPRWSGWRILVQSITLGGVFFVIGIVRAWTDWKFDNPMTSLVLALLLFALAAILLLYWRFETYRRQGRAQIHVSPSD